MNDQSCLLDKNFFLRIDTSFDVKGRGSVVTGQVSTGVIHVGEVVVIHNPHNEIKATVSGIEMFRELIDQAESGDNPGLLLGGVSSNQIDENSYLTRDDQKIYDSAFTPSVLVTIDMIKYNSLIKENKEDEAIEIALNNRQRFSSLCFTSVVANYYYQKDQEDKALQIIDDDMACFEEIPVEEYAELNYLKAEILLYKNNFVEARKACLEVMRCTGLSETGLEYQRQAEEIFSECEESFVNFFTDIPYSQRKLLIPVKSYTNMATKSISVIKIDNMPELSFPMGHPMINQLYVGHPYLSSKYVPFEKYELSFLEDKVREFCQIMQSLGATEINIETINTTNNNGERNTHQRYSGGLGYGPVSVSGQYSSSKSNKLLEEISHKLNLHQRFTPISAPKLPDNLVWFKNEPSWQRLYEQRMQGSLVEHEERIESQESRVVENSELTEISADLKYLAFKANLGLEKSIQEKLESHDNAILSIHVTFAPLNSLGMNVRQSSVLTLTPKEEEYLQEFKECLSDSGKLSSSERRLLNRLRLNLGLSERRAQELEAYVCNNKLTEEEELYLDEYLQVIQESGILSSSERRLLNRYANDLGITTERVQELEAMH